MTFGQLGWIDAIGFGFAVLLEIPSGAVADLLGKRKTILVGMIAGAIGVFIITFSGSLTGIFIGWLISQICFAFYSGAAEALAYDTLVDLKDEKNYDKVISKSSEIESYAGAATTLIGGFLFAYNFRLPHILWGCGFVIGAILAWFLVEPKVDTEKFSFKVYLKQLSVGFRELTQTGLRRFLGFFFILVGVYYLYSWGFIRPAIATSFGFYAKEQGIILPLLTLYGALIVRTVPYFKKKLSDISGLVILSIIMALGFLISSFPVGYYGLIAMVLIATAGKLSSPWISIIVNKKIESKYRATTLSTVALMTKIPYVLIAVMAGKMVEESNLNLFNMSTATVIIIIAILSASIVFLRRNNKAAN